MDKGGLGGEKRGKTRLARGGKLLVAFLVLQGRPISSWWWQRWLRCGGGRGQMGAYKNWANMIFSQLGFLFLLH